MSLENRTNALRSLQERGLLAEHQFQAAIGDPHLADLADQPSPQATLAWLLRTRILDAADLLSSTSQHRTSLDSGPAGTRRALVIATLREINQDSVDALLAEALITQPIHEVISGSLMTDRALLTPAATMALVMEAGMMQWDEYETLRARPAGERSAAANAILAETAVLIETRNRALKREFWRNVFPGPLWLYIVGVPLLIAAVFWYNTASSAAPNCTSQEARKALDRTILMTYIGNRTRAGESLPSVRDLREVGYNKVGDIYGCSAQMTADGESEPFAYVIARNRDGNKGGFVLSGAEPEIVAARFGALDANGDFAHKAEPIGRSNLDQAFRAGTTALVDDPVSRRTMALMRGLAGSRVSADTAKPERATDIEPLGACRAVASGTGYTCPLLVEWKNPLMGILGQSDRQMLRGDFTFEPNAAGATPAWRVSAEFAKEVRLAQLAAANRTPVPENASAPAAK